MTSVDPLSLQVFANLFSAIADEMGVTLQRAAYSPNITMRRDFSCAVFDAEGRLLAQAAHIPVHLGAMPMAMDEVRDRFDLQRGDMVIMNDPYAGGTHLPDISLVSAAFSQAGRRLGYVMSRAHHSDVGGMSPGSMPLSTEIYQEGIIIPPVLLWKAGALQRGIIDLILRNVRTPVERHGDFEAQVAAQRVGETGLCALADRYGADTVAEHGSALQSYAEAMMRSSISRMEPGDYLHTDYLDGDGQGTDHVPIQVKVSRSDASSDLIIDFSNSAPQCLGCINAVKAVTISATLYVMRCLLGEEAPVNAGSLVPLLVRATPGTIVCAQLPGAVAGGNVETSQRIVDTLFGALATALPDVVPAASQGTMNNLAFGGFDARRKRPFAYYETMGGGMGGRPHGDGADAVHDHMSNTLNTPVERLESEYPLRVRRYELCAGTGGHGLSRGGDGLRRDLEFLEPTTVTLLTERRARGPYGLQGGEAGEPGKNTFAHDGKEEVLPAKVTRRVLPGDLVSIRSPGGGGWGSLPQPASR